MKQNNFILHLEYKISQQWTNTAMVPKTRLLDKRQLLVSSLKDDPIPNSRGIQMLRHLSSKSALVPWTCICKIHPYFLPRVEESVRLKPAKPVLTTSAALLVETTGSYIDQQLPTSVFRS